MNRITGPYTAEVNGRSTGLAGCSNLTCRSACLRKSTKLEIRNDLCRHGDTLGGTLGCQYFIGSGDE